MSNPQVVHSKLSFSGRERWKKCPLSVHMSAGMPDSSSPAAEEGTTAHTVAEFYVCQRFGLKHRDFGAIAPSAECADMPVPDGVDLKGKTPAQWNDDLRRHGKDYRDFIVGLIPIDPATGKLVEHYVVVEQKVSIPSISPDLFGTADCLIWLPSLKRVIVVDYKYGYMSVDVGTADDTNEQLAAYLVAAEDGLMARHILPQSGTVAVYQPRRVLQKPGQSLDVERDWFGRERDKLAREVAAVQNPGGPVPGDHCRYCKGKAKCPATHNAVRTALEAHCGEKNLLDMPEDQLVQIFAARAAFKAFWEDVEERIEQLVKAGHKNLQVQEGKGRRMWGDVPLATQTFLALGRTDLLQPVALSEAMQKVPEAFLAGLVATSKPSRTIKVVDAATPSAIAGIFKQYVKKD